MACRTVQLPGGGIAIMCGRGVQGRTCIVCHRSEYVTPIRLCDFPLTGDKAGQTCDRVVCVVHAHHEEPDFDVCPAHARRLSAAETADKGA